VQFFLKKFGGAG